MLRQILEALVRPWENFFPVRDKTQAVVLLSCSHSWAALHHLHHSQKVTCEHTIAPVVLPSQGVTCQLAFGPRELRVGWQTPQSCYRTFLPHPILLVPIFIWPYLVPHSSFVPTLCSNSVVAGFAQYLQVGFNSLHGHRPLVCILQHNTIMGAESNFFPLQWASLLLSNRGSILIGAENAILPSW